MEVDGDIEVLRARKDGPVSFIVVKTSLVVIVDECADEAKLLDTACEFLNCGGRVRHGEHCPASETRRVFLDPCEEGIVGVLALSNICHDWNCGDDLFDNVAIVHVSKAQVGEGQ